MRLCPLRRRFLTNFHPSRPYPLWIASAVLQPVEQFSSILWSVSEPSNDMTASQVTYLANASHFQNDHAVRMGVQANSRFNEDVRPRLIFDIS